MPLLERTLDQPLEVARTATFSPFGITPIERWLVPAPARRFRKAEAYAYFWLCFGAEGFSYFFGMLGCALLLRNRRLTHPLPLEEATWAQLPDTRCNVTFPPWGITPRER